MKRLIKFYNKYKSDSLNFSTCSTEREILPVLVPDEAGDTELLALAKSLGFPYATAKAVPEQRHYNGGLEITHAVEIGEKELSHWREKELVPEYLAFITLPSLPIPTLKTLDNEITQEQAHEILCNQAAGISDVGETVDGEIVLVKSEWSYYHIIPLHGYSLKAFETLLGVTEEGFEDDTFRCSDCGKFDSNDNGYTYNYRIVNDCDQLGIRCGCYDEYCLNSYTDFVNNADHAIELKTAKKLEKQGAIEFIERFIGGMTDGRGGRFNGEFTREGTPKEILATLLKDEPDGEFLFTHDESGQFQTYFSAWRVVQEKNQ